MKIKQIRAVSVEIPQSSPKSKARRTGWNERAPRAFPINKYAEFSGFHETTPGSKLNIPVWVQVVADDGTWGLGRCGFGDPVAVLIDSYFSPLLEGRDPMALEFLNDLMWRSTQLFSASGIAAVAQSGVDLALWDLKGKLLNCRCINCSAVPRGTK